ncbi:MAG: bifunctional folylpolyglutamate synthase/dihydrofolate synthase [Candidatus Diapherotrites archaeon]|nr:bifunctional folylpolyglutamate synthase/dihydrofolate synthase [Candidatus Diapherotrites archaeon]
MNYLEALSYLNSLDFKMKGFNLDTIKELMRISNIDYNSLRVIHVAGSNGKGSTVCFISSILKEAGYKVGSYYSPHLFRVNERIRINDSEISDDDFARLISFFVGYAEKMKKKPSYFELLTAAAIKHFLDNRVDFAVIETGMGGRLDATNIFKETVSVITAIDLEHVQYLGNTIEKIAFEKSSIIKKYSVVVFDKNNKGKKVILEMAKKKRAKILNPLYEIVNICENGCVFNIKRPLKLDNLEIKFIGRHYVKNASLACCVAFYLNVIGFPISENAIREGLKNAYLKGRFEVIQKNPLIILDVAHNPSAVKSTFESLNYINFNKLIVVFSCLADKDFRKMLKCIKSDLLIICEIKNKRAASVEMLAKYCPKNCVVIKNPKIAFEQAKLFATKKDLILILGSHYLIEQIFS